MNSQSLIKRILDESKKSEDDLSDAISKLKASNRKDAIAIESEVYKVVASGRYQVISNLLDIVGESLEDEPKEESKKNFYARYGK